MFRFIITIKICLLNKQNSNRKKKPNGQHHNHYHYHHHNQTLFLLLLLLLAKSIQKNHIKHVLYEIITIEKGRKII